MFTLNCRGKLLVIDRPIVMGILNVTPDSFYEGSRVNADSIVEKAGKMIEEGAAILDIGGQTTRPGSARLPEKEESLRVIPAIEKIKSFFPNSIISVDTYYASVAEAAMAAGASIVNDISAGTLDTKLLSVVAKHHVPYVLMHMKGEPSTMQIEPAYENITIELLDFFSNRIQQLKQSGIIDIIIDPGFGFGKSISHNFQLMRQLEMFRILNKPLLVGISRKSTIYKTLGTDASNSLNGTTAMHMVALMKGASILRVHDVKEAVETIKLYEAIKV